MLDVSKMTEEELSNLIDGPNSKVIEDALVSYDLKSWQDKFGGDHIALSVANLEKIIQETWQLWDTYNDSDVLMYLYGRKDGLDNVDLGEEISLEELIQKIRNKEDADFNYEVHQYCDYATIFFNISKRGIEIDCPFANDNWGTHILEDLSGECQRDIPALVKVINEALNKPT